jgi:hypothetical protein
LVGWHGQFTLGDIKHPTIIFEAVASYDRWIWHTFFLVAGFNNGINVLNQSPLFIDVIRGHTPAVPFIIMVVSATWDTISPMVYIPHGRCS